MEVKHSCKFLAYFSNKGIIIAVLYLDADIKAEIKADIKAEIKADIKAEIKVSVISAGIWEFLHPFYMRILWKSN